jgi:transposase
VDEARTPKRRDGLEAQDRSRGASSPQRARTHQIARALAQGASAHGFRGDVWTCERVAEVIRKEFGVVYHPAHVSRLLKS